jgi:hypothetical protein
MNLAWTATTWPLFNELRTLKHPLFLPALEALFVKESGAIAAAHIARREPLKTLTAVRRTLFSVLSFDPWRIEPEMRHDLHLYAISIKTPTMRQ